MTRIAAAAVVLLLLFGGAWAAEAQDELIELEVTVDGEEQIFEVDPADGPVQGLIIDRTVIIESLVAYETEDGWELTPKTVVTRVGPDSPLYGLDRGDDWVIAPNENDETEELDG